jgi:hypothetical protein
VRNIEGNKEIRNKKKHINHKIHQAVKNKTECAVSFKSK